MAFETNEKNHCVFFRTQHAWIQKDPTLKTFFLLLSFLKFDKGRNDPITTISGLSSALQLACR